MPLFPDQSGSLACRLPLSVHQSRGVLGPKMYIGCCHKPEQLKRGSCQIMILPFRTAIEVSNLNRLYMESIAFYSVPSRSLANMFSTKEELQNTNFSKSLKKCKLEVVSRSCVKNNLEDNICQYTPKAAHHRKRNFYFSNGY